MNIIPRTASALALAALMGGVACSTLAQSIKQEVAVELLAERGLVKNRSIDGSELVRQAAAGNLENVELLLAAGVPPDVHDQDGWPALLKAVDQGQMAAVKVLIDAGADIEGRDRIGRTAFVIATQRGYIDILRVLLDAKAESSADQ